MSTTARARAVLQGVTAGPWEVRDDGADEITVGAASYLKNPGSYRSTDLIVEYDVYSDTDIDRAQRFRNAQFIAEARELLPALIAENEALAAELRRHTVPAETPF